MSDDGRFRIFKSEYEGMIQTIAELRAEVERLKVDDQARRIAELDEACCECGRHELATWRKVSEWLAYIISRVGDYTELTGGDWKYWSDIIVGPDDREDYDPVAGVLTAAREAVKDDE